MSVRIERDGPVWTVVLDRPEVRNAIDTEHAQALLEAFEAFDADGDAAVAVLWGAGGTFCAGADLRAVADGTLRVAPPGEGPPALGPTRLLLTKPVIAAVEGHAVAGGLELALWCDLRVADPTAVFGVFCRRWGVPLIDGGTVRLPRLIGLSHALDMILTGRGVGPGRQPGWVWPTGLPGLVRPGPRPKPWPASWPPSPRPACAATAGRPTSRPASPWRTRSPTSGGTGSVRWPRAPRRRPPLRRRRRPARFTRLRGRLAS